jgi:hypothetical protein
VIQPPGGHSVTENCCTGESERESRIFRASRVAIKQIETASTM